MDLESFFLAGYVKYIENPYIRTAILRTFRLKFSVMYYLNIRCSFKETQPENQCPYIRIFTVLLKIHKTNIRFYRFLPFIPFSIESFQFLNMWMTFNHLKTNCTEFAHHRLKNSTSYRVFVFQSLMQLRFYGRGRGQGWWMGWGVTVKDA